MCWGNSWDKGQANLRRIPELAAKRKKSPAGRADVALAMLYKIEMALQIELRRFDLDQTAAPEGIAQRNP